MTSVENNTCWTGTASTHGTNSTNTATATCTTVKTEAEIVPSETKTNIQIQGKYRIISFRDFLIDGWCVGTFFLKLSKI